MRQIFSIIRKNQKLAERRNPMYDRNRFAKVMIYFMVVFWAAYMVFFGFLLPLLFEELFPSMEPYHIMNQGITWLLLVDFLLRFAIQPSVAQEVKPYLLMPVKRKRLVDCFLLQSLLSGYNLFWFFLMAPFALFTVIRFYGFLGMGCWLLGIWLLMILNNYWYLICRTLLGEKMIYILLPIGVYGLLALLEFVPEGNLISTFTMNLGEGYIEGKWWSYLGTVIAIACLFLICRTLQLHFIRSEVERKEDTKMKHVSEYKFLDRYGEVGEYLRLELKLCMRNKLVKTQIRMGFILTLAFSALVAFTDIYDGTGMVDFICIYNYAIFGIMILGQVMSFEGNYLDGLMSRKESVYSLLRAKYYFNCLFLLVPFLFLLIPVARGKVSLLMAVAYMFFTAGLVFAALLQVAVYNKKTLPLNASLMQGNKGSSMSQSVIMLAALFLPQIVISLLTLLFPQDTALLIMLGIGLVLIATHQLWIKNIYNRFMKRRYENMEGFRESR